MHSAAHRSVQRCQSAAKSQFRLESQRFEIEIDSRHLKSQNARDRNQDRVPSMGGNCR